MKNLLPLLIVTGSFALMGSTCDEVELPTCNCRTTQSTCPDMQTCIQGACKGQTTSTMNGMCTDDADGPGGTGTDGIIETETAYP